MSTVGTAIFSTGSMQRKMAEDTYEIVYPGITEEALQNLREQPEIARAGLQYSLGTDDNNETGGLLSMTYGDEDALYAGRKQSQLSLIHICELEMAEASHDLFANRANGRLYKRLVEPYIMGERRL